VASNEKLRRMLGWEPETLIAGIHHPVGMGLAKEIPGRVSGLKDATIGKH